jgi:Zn-dependent alcohol dehydrogenase
VKITGAVLDRTGPVRPYRSSTPLSIGDVELDDPHPGELTVAVEAAGVCHSDLSVIDGNRRRPVPMLLGHEGAGRIIALGDGTGDLRIGQRVVLTFLPRCGRCRACASDGRIPCERGTASNAAGELLSGGRRLTRRGEPVHHHLGVSAFATHAVVDRQSVVAVDDDVPPDIAAVLGCAVLTGGGAVLHGRRPARDEAIAVVGLGGVGMAALLTAVGLGHPVIAVDTLPAKLELARALGAAEAMTPADAASRGVRVQFALECAGHSAAFEAAFAMTTPGGTTTTVGLPGPNARASLSPALITAEARTITGSYLGSAVPSRDIPQYVAMWRAGALPLERLITSHIRLEGVNAALDDLADGRALRQVISFG